MHNEYRIPLNLFFLMKLIKSINEVFVMLDIINLFIYEKFPIIRFGTFIENWCERSSKVDICGLQLWKTAISIRFSQLNEVSAQTLNFFNWGIFTLAIPNLKTEKLKSFTFGRMAAIFGGFEIYTWKWSFC